MDRQTILSRLMALRDEGFRSFQQTLIPEIQTPMLGVRTPALRALAREAAGQEDTAAFLAALPHEIFEENQLHAFILSEMKAFEPCVAGVDAFLPFVDNWATCDQMSPKCFRKNRKALLPHVERWLGAEHPFTVRFGLGMLMEHYLDGDFDPAYLSRAAAVSSAHYYVKMMAAWYFATALAKQYEAAVPYIEEGRLEAWTCQKAIQKALESRRVTEEHKEYLRALRQALKNRRD